MLLQGSVLSAHGKGSEKAQVSNIFQDLERAHFTLEGLAHCQLGSRWRTFN